MSKAPNIPFHHHIVLSEGWELIQRADDTLLLARIIDEDRWILEIGLSNFDDPHMLEEGIRQIMSEGHSLQKEN